MMDDLGSGTEAAGTGAAAAASAGRQWKREVAAV